MKLIAKHQVVVFSVLPFPKCYNYILGNSLMEKKIAYNIIRSLLVYMSYVSFLCLCTIEMHCKYCIESVGLIYFGCKTISGHLAS